MINEPRDVLIQEARRRNDKATVFLLPRDKGDYEGHATDMIALLEESGLVADYATDPMTAGVYEQKSADLILPPILVVFANAAELASAIDGIVHIVRWFLRHDDRRLVVDVLVQREADGSTRREVHVVANSADEAERLIRAAGELEAPA